MSKQEIRKVYLNRRNNLSSETVKVLSAKIEEQILHLIAEHDPQVILAYAAFRNEPELYGLIEKLLCAGKIVGLPKCGKNGQMTMYRITNVASLQAGAYGILEPPEETVVLPESADLVLVPGCAFSRNMERLGYGGGYYDRYLPLCNQAIKAGICFDLCLTDALPLETFDIKMDCIITEAGLVNKV